MWYAILIAALTAYLLGNLNGAVCISSLLANDDVRRHGSGNAGLTNFARNYGGWASLLVLLVDCGKTVVACLSAGLILAPYCSQTEGMMLGAVAVTLGHDFPALLGFRGGKGILSGVTVAAVIDWRIALIILGVFAVVYFTTHYVSLASVLGAAAFSISFAVLHRDALWVLAGGVFLGLLAIFMHRGNIARLCKGTEKKTSFFKKEKNQ